MPSSDFCKIPKLKDIFDQGKFGTEIAYITNLKRGSLSKQREGDDVKNGKLLNGISTMVKKLTAKGLAPIPGYRWEVYANNSLYRQKQILSNIAYCRDLQNGQTKKRQSYPLGG